MALLLPIINKHSEFPIPAGVWDRLWQRAQTLYPERAQLEEEVRGKSQPTPPMPRLLCLPSAPVEQQLIAIQKFVESFQYNHTGTQLFDVKKDKPLSRLLETAKDILREALPIKCLEAVILFLHLTMDLDGVDRFPISFKSAFHGQQHRHIVLGVRHAGRYGALGLSRRDTLMYKPLTFVSLGQLIADYDAAYAAVGHTIVRVRVGRAAPHDAHSSAPIDWRALVVHPTHFSPAELARVLDRFARGIRAGTLPSEAVVLRHPERSTLGGASGAGAGGSGSLNATVARLPFQASPPRWAHTTGPAPPLHRASTVTAAPASATATLTSLTPVNALSFSLSTGLGPASSPVSTPSLPSAASNHCSRSGSGHSRSSSQRACSAGHSTREESDGHPEASARAETGAGADKGAGDAGDGRRHHHANAALSCDATRLPVVARTAGVDAVQNRVVLRVDGPEGTSAPSSSESPGATPHRVASASSKLASSPPASMNVFFGHV